MKHLKRFIKYLGIGILSVIITSIWAGPTWIIFTLMFGSSALIANSVILTILEKDK